MLSNNDRKIIRFVLGVTTGFTIAQLIDWQLSYIMPILLSMLLSGSQINFKAGLLFFLVITGGCLFGFLLSLTVVNYPGVCILVFTVALLHIFLAANRGLSPFAVIMLMMGVTVIPLVGIPSVQLSVMIVEALVKCGFVAVGLAILFFSIIPSKEEVTQPVADPADKKALTNEQSAIVSTLVILPLITIFYTFSITSSILILVFAAILAQNVNLTTTAKGGAALVIANAMGGVAAMILYQLLRITPEPVFMVPLMALAATVFAGKIFSNDPYAQLYSSAFTTVLLLVGSTLSSESGDAGEAFITRLVQVFLAAAYVVTSFYLLKRLANYLRPIRLNTSAGERAVTTDVPG